ncbi:MAG: phytoene/squalene synthase family protein [Flavobacteriales bacterium]|nr:phytoene/squalene synthase family protein [Flavobacteriales bacterium]
MKALFDEVSAKCSKLTTRSYSTSFSLGIYLLDSSIRKPIYGIYGFVRLADEIVDSFHGFDKSTLLDRLKMETYRAIDERISLNPILNSFQEAVNQYQIEHELIETFLNSMEMDLDKNSYNQLGYEKYILGSAEVVGLMCLRVFTYGNDDLFKQLKPAAQKLGSAFQKINFLRDVQADFKQLGRTYFPDVEMEAFSNEDKFKIEKEIELEFQEALVGIKQLPTSSRLGVYVAYVYYLQLLKRIKNLPANRMMEERVSVPNSHKFGLMVNSFVKHQLNLL